MTTPNGTTTPDLLEMRQHSDLEFTLWVQMDQAGLCMPFWQRKVNGHKVDFCWPSHHVIVECQGATWQQGAHTREPGYSKDRLFSNRAQLDGWRVLEFTGDQIDDLTALGMIVEALERKAP